MIPVAREVQPPLLVIGILIAAAHYKFGLALLWPAWLLFVILLFFFRDFKRKVPAIPLAVVSPIDGRVIEVIQVHDPYLDRATQCIHLQQFSFGEFNVHSPIEGKVQNLWVTSPTTPAHSQLAVWIQTDEQDDAVMAANLDSALRHASCHVSVGEKLGQGQRCGFMAFACEVVIYLPATAHIAIKVGQSVRAGSDKLAEFVHETATS